MTKKDDEIAEALYEVARSIIKMGNAGATTPQGTIVGGFEGLGQTILTAGENIADGLHDLASAIRETKESN